MARVKFGVAVADMRGSIAGSTFSSGTYGAYVRRKATPTNPNTVKQGNVRAAFASISSSWRTLTEAQRETWITQAPNYTRLNSFGDNVPLTGQALFMRCNLNRHLLGLSQLTYALPPVDLQAPTAGNLTISVGGNTINLTNLSATDADTMFAVYICNVVSGGIKFFGRSVFRYCDQKNASSALATLALRSRWESTFGNVLSSGMIGQKIAVYVTAISISTGQSVNSAQYVGIVQA